MLSEEYKQDIIQCIFNSEARELFSYINRRIVTQLHYLTTIHIGSEIIPIKKIRVTHFNSNNFIDYLLKENSDALNNILKKIGGFQVIPYKYLDIENTFLNIEPINFCDYIFMPLYQCFAEKISIKCQQLHSK